MLTITITIPALNAEKTIARTLSAIQSNAIQADEVFVIDGLSQDRTVDIAGKFNCTVITNPVRHTAAAHQKGIMEAHGEIIAMTDADCVPDPDWLYRIRQHFLQDAELDGVGGPVRLKHPCNRVQSYCASKAIAGTPQAEELITRKGMRGRFSGANCAYRRQALMDVGGFNQSLKAHGSDIDLFWRLLDRKARLLFDPGLTVEHLGFSEDYHALARKSFGYGMASAHLARLHFPQRILDLSFYYKPLTATIFELLHRDRKQYPLCVFVDQFMFALGRTWGLLEK
jgi:cellulose synthase/poly-beta-1,6-N-acetylglucosamine synthase-like glycosyltransferase